MRLQETVTFLRDGLFLSGILVTASGCSGLPEPTQRDINLQKSKSVAELTDTRFYPQEVYQCGPAALATVLESSDVKTSTDSLVNKIYIPDRKGSLQLEIIAATRALNRLPYVLDPGLDSVIAEIDAGRPVLVLQNLGVNWLPRWHYAVAVGYDKNSEEIILRSGITERKRYSFKLFDRTWRRGDRWAMVVLKPTELPTFADEEKYLRTIIPFERTRQWTIALQAYNTAQKKWLGSLGASMGAGNSYYALKQFPNAVKNYKKALAIDPNHAPAHNNIANAFLQQGKIREAEKHARKAITIGGPHLASFKETLEEIQKKLR